MSKNDHDGGTQFLTSPAADDRTRGLWGGPPAEEEDGEQLITLIAEEEEPGTYLDDEQLARIEALGHARSALLVSGPLFGGQSKLEPWQLTYVAEWILKGPDVDAEDDGGTDAEDDAPTDGGSAETGTEASKVPFGGLKPRPVRDAPQA